MRPYKEGKYELANTKKKNLLNAIKFADKISHGELTFNQHSELIKEGIKLCEEQMEKLNENKKEKITITIDKDEYIPIKGEMIKFEDKETDNDFNKIIIENIDENSDVENCPKNKNYHFLGNKRKESDFTKDKNNSDNSSIISNSNKNSSNNLINYNNNYQGKHFLDLIYSIEDFIYSKRDFIPQDLDNFFETIQEKISLRKLNPNGFKVSFINFYNFFKPQAVLKLQKYLNSKRNFNSQISSRKTFINLKAFLNKKIIENLFDKNYISSSIIEEDISNFLLEEEEDDICSQLKKLDMKKKIKVDPINNDIKTLDDNIKKEEFVSVVIETVDDHNNNNLMINNIAHNNNAVNNMNSLNKKKSVVDSEDETFGSKNTKMETFSNEESKHKLIITPLNENSLFDLANYLDKSYKYEYTKSTKNLMKTKEKLKIKYKALCKHKDYALININVKKPFLRKAVCSKLFKGLKIALKNLELTKNEIQNLCIDIEYKARSKDSAMRNIYKILIVELLKKMSK